MPGVLVVWTGADVADWTLPVSGLLPHLTTIARPPLAEDVVRAVGDPVRLVVVASDPWRAADAAEAVDIDSEPMPAVLDLDAAQFPDVPKCTPISGPTSRT